MGASMESVSRLVARGPGVVSVRLVGNGRVMRVVAGGDVFLVHANGHVYAVEHLGWADHINTARGFAESVLGIIDLERNGTSCVSK